MYQFVPLLANVSDVNGLLNVTVAVPSIVSAPDAATVMTLTSVEIFLTVTVSPVFEAASGRVKVNPPPVVLAKYREFETADTGPELTLTTVGLALVPSNDALCMMTTPVVVETAKNKGFENEDVETGSVAVSNPGVASDTK